MALMPVQQFSTEHNLYTGEGAEKNMKTSMNYLSLNSGSKKILGEDSIASDPKQLSLRELCNL